MLDKDTLGLFVDDGLQVGKFRKVNSEKLDVLKPFGNVEKVLEEDKARWELGGEGDGSKKEAPAGATKLYRQVQTGLNRTVQIDRMEPFSVIKPEKGSKGNLHVNQMSRRILMSQV